jgi:hypothetical protein
VSALAGIPTLIVAGCRGAGKSTLIGRLLQERPAGQTWGALVGEHGAARVQPGNGVALAEVVPGCPCCTAQVAFRVALAGLLRDARPVRLFIELGEASHVDLVLKVLASPWLAPALALGPLVEVVATGSRGVAPAPIDSTDVLCVRGDVAAVTRCAGSRRVIDACAATLAGVYGTMVNEPR